MTRAAESGHPMDIGRIAAGALWMGCVIGLAEGVGWLVAQRFDRITSVWTQVTWLAPVVDGLLFLLVALVASGASRVLPVSKRLPFVAFAVALAASANVVALILQRFVHPLAVVALALGLAAALTRGFLRRPDTVLRFFGRTLRLVLGAVLCVFVGVQGYDRLREGAAVAGLPEASASPPNVVVVVIDALRADHVSAYGYARETTPFIDALAAEGALFERAVSSSPYSLPSHASLLSGLPLNVHGVEWLTFNDFGDAEYPSIAEALLGRGYRTAAFSANPFWFTREQGFGRGFTRFEDFYRTPGDLVFRTVFGKAWEKIVMPRIGLEDVPGRVDATRNTEAVLRWVGREDRHPFFAFINYFDVHDPYLPPAPYRGMFSEREHPGGILNWRLGRDGGLDAVERESEIEAYDGALAYVDHEIGRLAEGIARLRPDDELLIIVTSDHGEAFGEHGFYLHGKSMYREEIHIPLVVRWPGRVPAGIRIDRPVTHASIPSTILDLVSGGEAETFGDPSLVPLMTGDSLSGRWPLALSEMGQRDWVDPAFPVRHGGLRSLVDREWQYIAPDSLPEELYSWSDVPQEHDRAGDPGLEPVLRTFREELAGRRWP